MPTLSLLTLTVEFEKILEFIEPVFNNTLLIFFLGQYCKIYACLYFSWRGIFSKFLKKTPHLLTGITLYKGCGKFFLALRNKLCREPSRLPITGAGYANLLKNHVPPHFLFREQGMPLIITYSSVAEVVCAFEYRHWGKRTGAATSRQALRQADRR